MALLDGVGRLFAQPLGPAPNGDGLLLGRLAYWEVIERR